MSSKIKQNVLMIALLIALFAAVGWILGQNNYFVMDDYTTIYIRGIIEHPTQSFSFLPQARYNDRPVGTIFVGILYYLFGMNAQGYHFVFVLVHLCNVYLVWNITKKLLCRFSISNASLTAFIAAAIFGAYPQSIMAPQWVSAVFDLLCCFFVLCSLYYFIKKDERDYYIFDTVMTCLAYMLSLRAKEMSILLPCAYIVLDLIWRKEKKWGQKTSASTRISFIWMVIYLIKLFSFPAMNAAEYQQEFSIVSLCKSLFKYIALYFNLFDGLMTFEKFDITILPGLAICVIMIVIACYSLFKRKQLLPVISFVFVGFMLAPVLTMDNMQHILYLYIPSIFIAIAFSACISEALGYKKHFGISSLICIIIVAVTNYMPGPQAFRTWWCAQTIKDRDQLGQIYRLGDLPQYCNLYVRGAGKEYNVIYPYGPGNSVKMLYNRSDINVEVVDEFPMKPNSPYVFWDYQNGIFIEIDRQEECELSIKNVSYSRLDDENVAIGVECSIISNDMKLIISGQEYQTTIGDTFISTIYPYERNSGEDKLEIQVYVPSLEMISKKTTLVIK